MKVLIDTCILVDFLQNRMPFADDADKILTFSVQDKFQSYFTSKAVTDINYILKKRQYFNKEALLMTGRIWQLCTILDTKAEEVFNSLFSKLDDYEDALMVETAKNNHLDAIVTRNAKDFANADIKVYSPKEFLTLFA